MRPTPGNDVELRAGKRLERYNWSESEQAWEDAQGCLWWENDFEYLQRMLETQSKPFDPLSWERKIKAKLEHRRDVVQRASQEAGARICAERQSVGSDATGQSASTETELCGADCGLSE